MGYPSIVQENVSDIAASAPSALQQSGALISQGGTNLAGGAYAFLAAAPSLTPLLANALALSSLAWSGGTVVATATATLAGLATSDQFITTIAGATPAAYNGTFLCTVTGADTFTYALAANPGTETVAGTYTPNNQGELQAMVNTFFAQGGSQGVYVLELGAGDGTNGPPALGTWITNNPKVFYSYLVPRLWDGTSAYKTLIASYESLSSKTYFFTTTTISSYSGYTALMKDVLAAVEAPALALTEFSLAADFQHTLAYDPSPSNQLTQNDLAYLYGVTPYPLTGNSALLQTLENASINFVATGAEGGLSNAIMMPGETMDANDFTWWYAGDWIQINTDLNIAAAVIQGSNNPQAPLRYNQAGINTLQGVAVATIQTGIASGLLNGNVTQTQLAPSVFTTNLQNGVYAGQNVVNAVPFPIYTQLNPNDYGNKVYKGFSVVAIPQNGFKQIVFNILVTNLIGSF